MEFTLTTPALLFPTISLLLLAYTNRFLGLSAVIRNLHASHKVEPHPFLLQEIASLRYRLRLIRNMQAIGVLSLLLCVISMIVLFTGLIWIGKFLFAVSLILMALSLALSVREIQISIEALNLHLSDIEDMT
jgi:Zn-dependent membrane protease YugP